MGRPTELLGVAELNELLEGRSLEVNSEVASFDGMNNYAPELYLEAGGSLGAPAHQARDAHGRAGAGRQHPGLRLGRRARAPVCSCRRFPTPR